MKMNPTGKLILASVALAGMAATITSRVRAQDDEAIRLTARLNGFHEVAPKNTVAHGSFRATVSEDRKTINWTVTWEDLSGPPTQAHIHIAQPGVNGVIVVFFCGPNVPNNDKGTCPQMASATISGSFTAADIKPLAPDQGFADGQLGDVLRYILAGDGYANVHTAKYPGGEIRGQIRVDAGEDN